MTKEESITIEMLAETINNKGLAAAEKLLENRRGKIDKQIGDAQKELAAAQKKLTDGEKEQSVLETILIGAVRKAAADAGIKLTAPTVKQSKQGKKQSKSKKRGPAPVPELSMAEQNDIQKKVLSALKKQANKTWTCAELAEATEINSRLIRKACDTPEASQKGIEKVKTKGPWPIFQAK